MKKVAACVVCGLAVLGVVVSTASALPPFMAEFKALYVKPDGSDEEKELAKAFDDKKCNVCHGKNDEGKDDKKVRNIYGKALDELLSKDDQGDKEKIKEALKEVAEKKIDEEDEESPTFGDRIKDGKLPGEPEEEEEGE